MTADREIDAVFPTLARIAEALDRLAPPAPAAPDLWAADAFVWHTDPERLEPVPEVNRVDLDLLRGVDLQRNLLLENTRRFARGLPANNALLWGARGMGKSSLVKAVHGAVNGEAAGEAPLALIELAREDIRTLPRLLALLRPTGRRAILFCDDLSFDHSDTTYKSLKAVLEGGVEGRPETVVFYATSNRRHLMARDMIDNEQSTAINPGEAVEEKVSLSDRFGLWLGFHACGQDMYLQMVQGYAAAYGLPIEHEALVARANEWAITRGARSGRVAWQFIQDLAGSLGCRLARTAPGASPAADGA
ncbi:MAG: ATP-binding protein [Rhodospirillaceae bacterium]|nr:ATP-binding protein [Rhodospirillaceae bacterium]